MAQPLSAPQIASAPRALGRYEIIGVLARGGMGTVYLARHSGEAGFQRLYAVKVMHPHLADDASFVDMLLDEARLAARLHHPNVVPIVDLGSQDGSHYVVMEYVEGCSLAALLAIHRDVRPPRLLIPLMLDALSGLHAAHVLTDDDGNPMNLVHRDVSPHNILVGIDGSARITDFGVAKAESSIHSTQPGQLKGKLAFMSPEHFRNSEKLDRRSDIFSAGAMLWSALTGRKLFLAASDAETLTNVLTMEIKAPSTVGLKPPAALDAVCMRALERDPDKRFPNALEMEEALRDAAMAAGVLGSKREVAAWISSSFEQELSDRRSVIRATVSQMGSSPGSFPGSTSSVSGFRMLPSLGPSTPTARAESSPSLPDFDVDMKGKSAPVEIATMTSTQGTPRRSVLLATAAILGLIGVTVVATTLVRSPQHSTATTAAPPAETEAAPTGAAPATVATQQASVAATVAVATSEPAAAPAPPPVVKRETPPARPWSPPAPPARPGVSLVAAAQPVAAPRPTVTAASPSKPAANSSKNPPIVPDEF